MDRTHVIPTSIKELTMNNVITIDLSNVAFVTGGQAAFAPCASIDRMKPSQLTGVEVAIGQRFNCIKTPTEADRKRAAETVPINGL
jgi:hypothetical protein